jgi:hypothetical protein
LLRLGFGLSNRHRAGGFGVGGLLFQPGEFGLGGIACFEGFIPFCTGSGRFRSGLHEFLEQVSTYTVKSGNLVLR